MSRDPIQVFALPPYLVSRYKYKFDFGVYIHLKFEGFLDEIADVGAPKTADARLVLMLMLRR